MMIQDKGFFVYKDGNSQLFSRSGALVLDGNSDMVLSGQGYQLQGYKMEETPLDGYQQAAELSTVNIPLGQKIDAKATTRVDYQCNLDSRSNAYLPYGFADLPFNAGAGHNTNASDYAVVKINGNEYEMAFTTTGVKAAAPVYSANNTGNDINYLNIDISNGGATTTLTFDITGVDRDTGLPNLSLPRVVDVAGTATLSQTPTTPATSGFVGWITPDNTTFSDGTGLTDTTGYLPVYAFPGQNPPQFFTVQYDDQTGALRIRDVDVTPTGTGNVPVDGDLMSAKAALFTYNVKDNMNYTNFQLKSSPNTDNVPAEIMDNGSITYDFIAEFDESITRGSNDISSLGKTQSKLKLWYYGYSNSDIVPTAGGATLNADAVEKMHRLDALVNFNADGTFESIEWESSDGDAPAGYHIAQWQSIIGTPPAATTVGPNFQIAVGTSSSATTSTDTLNFKQAQNVDNPGDVSNNGAWQAVGTTYQGGYHATKLTIYDDNGKDHTLEVTFKKLTENRWRWEAFLVEQDSSGQDVLVNIIPDPHSGEIEFDGSGRISNAIADSTDSQRRGDGNTSYPNAEVEIAIPFSLNGQPNSTVTLNFGGGVGSGGSALDGVTQFASETTTKPIYQDGYTMGILKSYSVAVDGTITGAYDNGVNIPLYRVALATFANEQGLEKVGNTMFKASVNSGNPNIDGATTNGKGSILSQYVEMSNVDLTEEFTHLIIAQRGFQANARTVTVSDQILEEVVNLKR